jgi:hypothetical protein
MQVDVTVEREADGRFLVKMQTHGWEANVRAPPDEIAGLHNIRGAEWNAGRSIAADRSAAESAFWTYENGQVSLLIGHDAETWDICCHDPRRGRGRANTSGRARSLKSGPVFGNDP